MGIRFKLQTPSTNDEFSRPPWAISRQVHGVFNFSARK